MKTTTTTQETPVIIKPTGKFQKQKLSQTSHIKDVWVTNFFDELAIVANYIDQSYNIIAFDTEFPGIVVDGSTYVKGKRYIKPHYQWIRENVNSSKVIQLGISISNEDGHQPEPISTWQFNFQFDIKTDDYNKESMELLENAGLDFTKHEKFGIPHQLFAEYIYGSGLLVNSNLKWVAFNSAFDFGYLLKMVTSMPLPQNEKDFIKQIETYFPTFYDVKHLRGDEADLNSQIRNEQITREGAAHQAGSDSLVTLLLYHKSLNDPIIKYQNSKVHGKNIIYKLGEQYKDHGKARQDSFNHIFKNEKRKKHHQQQQQEELYHYCAKQIQNYFSQESYHMSADDDSSNENMIYDEAQEEINQYISTKLNIQAPEFQQQARPKQIFLLQNSDLRNQFYKQAQPQQQHQQQQQQPYLYQNNTAPASQFYPYNHVVPHSPQPQSNIWYPQAPLTHANSYPPQGYRHQQQINAVQQQYPVIYPQQNQTQQIIYPSPSSQNPQLLQQSGTQASLNNNHLHNNIGMVIENPVVKFNPTAKPFNPTNQIK